jgi:hypothetical protein
MGLPGAKPRADRTQVVTRNKPAEWTEVPDVLHTGGPDLLPRTTGGEAVWAEAGVIPDEGWPPATRHWWEVVRAMPHAVLWTAGDWEFAQMTAEVHARTAEGWKGYVGSELRQREKLLGLYADARRDLRIRYIPAKPAVAASETPAGVARLDDYRDL